MLYNRGSSDVQMLAHALLLLCDKEGYDDTVRKLQKDIESVFEVQPIVKGVKKFDSLKYYPNGIIEFKVRNRYGREVTEKILCNPWSVIKKNESAAKKKKYVFDVKWLDYRTPDFTIDILRYINSKGKVQKKYFNYADNLPYEKRYNNGRLITWKVSFIDAIRAIIQSSLTGTNQYSINAVSANDILYEIKKYFMPMELVGTNWQMGSDDSLNDKDFCMRYIENFDNLDVIVKEIIKKDINQDMYLSNDGTWRVCYSYEQDDNSYSQLVRNAFMKDNKYIDFDYDNDTDFIKNKKFYRYDNVRENIKEHSRYYYERVKADPSRMTKDEAKDEFGYLLRKCECEEFHDKFREGIIGCYRCQKYKNNVLNSDDKKIPYCNITTNDIAEFEKSYMQNILPVFLKIYNIFEKLPDCDFKKFVIKKGFYDPKVNFYKFMSDDLKEELGIDDEEHKEDENTSEG